ncbi:GAF and ANTAR domain-containing protein [Actinocorallia longicatena]|uniref:ANTAR domain-containing protein n=1 Tax=Actinocorallia longicatena TaxID=111803 RepID=A0ABP6Q7G1_9ACTN
MTNRPTTMESVLGAMIEKAGGPLPGQIGAACADVLGADRASITVVLDEVRHTVCVTDPVAGHLDELQFTVGEGPWLEAYATGSVVVAADLSGEEARWPMLVSGLREFTERTGERVGGSMGVPLRVRGESPDEFRLGALNLLFPGRISVDRVFAERARATADAAALAVLGVMPDGRDLGPDWWTFGADLRRSVHLATGLIAERLGLALEDALLRLRTSAFVHGQTSSERAEEILATRDVTEEDL